MKFKIFYIIIFFFIFSCTQDLKNIKKIEKVPEKSFSSKGFALIYDDTYYNNQVVKNKLKNDENFVLHSFLKNKRLVSISNPLNSKSIIAEVINTAKYPKIYNIVITKKIAEDLLLDLDNPYVEIVTIKKNDKFVAKKATIFEEEKNVANKAPVTAIDINILSENKTITKAKKKNKPSYIIDIGDFYYYSSASDTKKRFKEEGNITNIKIKKIGKNKFKVYSGPYKSFLSMKDTYLSLNALGFEELNVINIKK